jgi:hypothetical protein
MSQKRKLKQPATDHKLGKHQVRYAVKGNHPSEVSGLFRDDPAFAEFLEILREQREEDRRQTNAELDAFIREEETRECSSSIPTRSRTTKRRTPSSPKR